MKTITYDETKWKLVPIDPTEDMEAAFDDAHYRASFRTDSYAAMLSAAPTPEGE